MENPLPKGAKLNYTLHCFLGTKCEIEIYDNLNSNAFALVFILSNPKPLWTLMQ